MWVDFGETPAGWTLRSLGEFCVEVRRPAGDAELPVLSVSKDQGIVLQREIFKKRIASKDTSLYKRVRYGEFAYDSMLLWSGSIARQERVPEGVISPAYYAFSVDDSVDHDFLQQLLKWERMLSAYEAISSGTNVRRRKASFEDFCRLRVPLPPLPEQTKIAGVLGSVDHTIDTTRQIVEQAQRVKAGLLHDLTTRGFGPDGRAGQQAAIWPHSSLAQLLQPREDSLSYGIVQPGSDHEGGVPMLRTIDLDDIGLSGTKILRVDPDIESRHPRTRLRGGEVLVSVMGTVGRSAVVPPAWSSWNVNRALAVVRLGDELEPAFFHYWLQSPDTQVRLQTERKGTVQQRVNLRDLRELKVPVPPLDEQRQIVAHLRSQDALISTHRSELARLERLERGLLHDLLTGTVRVPA
jgi:type I restriction enzyme S subunit